MIIRGGLNAQYPFVEKRKRIMILKSNRLLYGAFLLCLPWNISADLTTLQSWDPYPIFNAINFNTPPDTQFCTLVKRQIVDDTKGKRRKIGINFSPFVQRAIRAQTGPNTYFGDFSLGLDASGNPIPKPIASEMSDYQGTAYLMGLFLGKDENGKNIWASGVDNALTTNITGYNTDGIQPNIPGSVNETQLPINLQDAILALNGNQPMTGLTSGTAIIYNNPTDAAFTSPSILSQSVLEQDQTLFGAFSVPLVYQKTGLRWEANFDVSDNFGFIFRGGACQISQTAGNAIPLSNPPTPPTPGTSSNLIYQELNNTANTSNSTTAGANVPVIIAQATFDEWVTNNIDDLLDPVDGANFDIDSFNQSGFEDLRFQFFARHTFAMQPHEEGDYAPMLITPYAMIGYTVPLSPVRDYSILYSLPFGNNGHQSVGGNVGITFDFVDTVEIGFEGGATFFLPQDIAQMPVPNHELQRVLYPYRRDVHYAPGFNWQFGANLNAIEFIKNISFLFDYDFIQHTQDKITQLNFKVDQLTTQIGNEYFIPEMLEELSPWTSQMFMAAFDFKLQPGIHLSLAWQGALSQTNAYCSNTILGSLNFLF